MVMILIAAVLPALVLIYFIYRKDKFRKEPTGMLLKGFGFGALSALASFLISLPLGVMGFYPAEATTAAGHISTALFAASFPLKTTRRAVSGECSSKQGRYFEVSAPSASSVQNT